MPISQVLTINTKIRTTVDTGMPITLPLLPARLPTTLARSIRLNSTTRMSTTSTWQPRPTTAVASPPAPPSAQCPVRQVLGATPMAGRALPTPPRTSANANAESHFVVPLILLNTKSTTSSTFPVSSQAVTKPLQHTKT